MQIFRQFFKRTFFIVDSHLSMEVVRVPPGYLSLPFQRVFFLELAEKQEVVMGVAVLVLVSMSAVQ